MHSRPFTVFLCLAWTLAMPVFAQDEEKQEEKKTEPETETASKEDTETKKSTLPPGPPVQIVRRTVDNFLIDPEARKPFALGESAVRPMISTFTLDSPDGRYRVVWDPTACRIVGALDLKPDAPAGGAEPPSPFVLIASGAPPLSTALGATGDPIYFGFRIANGHPEFLYQHGTLAIEERIWFAEETGVFYQMYRVKNLTGALSLQFPAEWKPFLSAKEGEWKEQVLTFPASEEPVQLIEYHLTGGEAPNVP